MSQNSSPPRSGGKAAREKRRLSVDPPYKRPTRPAMPTTRRSPARPQMEVEEPQPQLPLASIMQELAALRRAMEAKFTEAGDRSNSLRNEVVGKLDANDKAVSELQLAVTDVTLSVDENQRAIHEVRAEVERREMELPGKVRAIVQEALDRSARTAPINPNQGVRHRPLSQLSPGGLPESGDGSYSKKEEAYDLARRSLRFWPVSRQGELATRTVEFMVNELMLDQQYASDVKFEVRRAGSNRGRDRDQSTAQRVKDEVIVTFDSIRTRDDVRSFAKNLEKKGRGLRLEIPDHLWPSFRALQELGYELKQKSAGLRRNILFDDSTGDLKMDFSHNNIDWRTVSPDDARKSLKKCRPNRGRRSSVSAGELEQLLGTPQADVDMNEEDREF